MTCIVGVRRRARTWLAADSGIAYGDEVVSAAAPKLRRCCGVILGVAGDARECDVVMLCRPDPWIGGELSAWVRDALWPAICAELHLRGGGREPRELEVLCGSFGRLVKLACGGAVIEDAATDYAAIGTGEQVALGYLYGSAREAPARRVRRAVEAACRHVGSVRGPVKVRSA